MSAEPKDLLPADFDTDRSRFARMTHRITELPASLRLCCRALGEGGNEGWPSSPNAFLASLVITTVLAYGVGLSQLFFEESLKSEPFDAKIEYARTPVENGTGWSNNTETMTGVRWLLTEFSTEFNDCTLVLGRQGIHSGGFFNFEFVVAQPLEMRTIVDDENPYWTNVTFDYPEAADAGPPISDKRAIRFLGPEAFDGELADRLSENIIAGLGEWPAGKHDRQTRHHSPSTHRQRGPGQRRRHPRIGHLRVCGGRVHDF